MAGEYVYNLQRVTKSHGKVPVITDLTLAFYFGAKIGVIGGNGAGKSTLLKIMAGVDKEFMGEVAVAKRAKIGYLPQEPQLDMSLNVQANVELGVAGPRAMIKRYDEICDLLGTDLSDEETDKLNNEMGDLQEKIDAADLWNLDHHVEMAMEALRVPPGDADVNVISGGERRRVALCQLLLSNPDVLLLDEPTNHLDATSVAWLEDFLKKYKGTIVCVTHDRYFLNNVTEWILEMEGGRGWPYKGNYQAWLEQKQKKAELEGKLSSARQKLLDQELAWTRLNPAGRQSKNKARLKRYEEMAAQVIDTREETITIQIPSGERLGDVVVRANNVSKAFGDRLLFDNVNFDLPRGGIVGIIGGNGAGKTTLFKMITGAETPTGGSLTLGPTVRISHVDQMRDALNANHSIWEEISGGVETLDLGGKSMNSRAYCSRFNFKGTDQQKKVGQLSGGERNRVHLAKLLRRGGNLLLLDEPSNDLDVDTLRSLEEGLVNFGGCAVVISHDRWFLDRVCTHILAFEDDGKVTWFEGNYEAYHENRRKLLGDEADKPHRMKFRPVKA